MNQNINIAIQVLPKCHTKNEWDIVDVAIAEIKKSGLPHMVCPFETSIEGPYDEIMQLIKKIHDACYEAGAEELLCNIKIHSKSGAKATIEEKMHKYK
jgi:uncharacterized protein YqgV (UPF0045/DUF77 family)